MLNKFTALSQKEPERLTMLNRELGLLPVKVSKCLWVSPSEFLETVNAIELAQWALQVSQSRPATHL